MFAICVFFLWALGVDKIEKDETITEAQRSFDGICEARFALSFCSKAIDDNFDGVLLLLLKLGRFSQHNSFTINART